jgi:hypothetical protein
MKATMSSFSESRLSELIVKHPFSQIQPGGRRALWKPGPPQGKKTQGEGLS